MDSNNHAIILLLNILFRGVLVCAQPFVPQAGTSSNPSWALDEFPLGTLSLKLSQ
jgi:hypothetical protein